MASSAAYAVDGNTAIQIMGVATHGSIQNFGPYSIYIGGSGVTDAIGFRLAAGAPIYTIPVALVALEKLYAIADSAAGETTSDVRVLTYSA